MKPKRTYSRKRIDDAFTPLKISRERKRQLRRVKAGLCIKCSEPIAPGQELCVKHRIEQALANRKKRNSRHPNKGKWVGAGNLPARKKSGRKPNQI
jgi:hypothetical protein